MPNMRRKIFIAHEWRLPKFIIVLLVLEFPLTVACLALFGIADPDTYRTKLWQNGADNGFNSAPNEILYAYANYRPIPVPLVWSSFMTQFNVIISVISTFVLLVKCTMYVMHVWIPLLSVFVHAVLVVLYAISVRNQAAPDMSDAAHPSPGMPWYLSKGCSYATPGNYRFCMMARASFAVAVVMIALFTVYLAMSIWSSIPTKAERDERTGVRRQEDIELKKIEETSPDSELSQEEKWERNRQMFLNLPKTPNTPGFGLKNPMTPRTVAFTALNGGTAPEQNRSQSQPLKSAGPKGNLPFRQQYA